MRFPSCMRWSSSRTDTGQKTLRTSSGRSSPRRSSSRATALPTPARMTSLIVPPNAARTRFTSSTEMRTVSKRRPSPTGALSDSRGATTWASTSDPIERPRSAARASASRGASARWRAVPTSSLGRVSRSRALSSMSRVGSGAGAATHSSGGSTVGSALKSRSTVAMSTPEMPSVSVWCDLWIEADMLAVVDTLDEPQLPQRSATVEHLHREALGELAQLPPGSRRGQRGDAHVIGDVEALVVDPHRPPLPEWHRHDPLAESGDELQARSDEGPHRRRDGTDRRAS